MSSEARGVNVVAIALLLLPGTLSALWDVLVADERSAAAAWTTGRARDVDHAVTRR